MTGEPTDAIVMVTLRIPADYDGWTAINAAVRALHDAVPDGLVVSGFAAIHDDARKFIALAAGEEGQQ